MKRIILLLVLAAAVMALFTVPAMAREGTEVTVTELLEDWEEYDGREVILRGEAVGDVMARGEYAWITVNDDTYSRQALHEEGALDGQNRGIGVWLPTGEAEKIGRLGRYGSVGDFVEVRGIFRADDEQHGGDFDIKGQSLTILEEGRPVDTSPDGWKYFALVAALLFLLVSLAPILKRRAREIQRAKALLAREED